MTEEQEIRESGRDTRFESGNTAAVRHGAYSKDRISRSVTIQRRRFLRRAGLRMADLDPIGRALLRTWLRAAAPLDEMDRFAAEHGYLDEAGEPRPFMRQHVAYINAERRSLVELDAHLRQRHDVSPLAVLEGEGRRIRLAAEEAEGG